MKKASDILKELIEVRSDTGTAYECAVGNKIYEMICQNKYFQEHPDHCGIWSEQDHLKRPLVWALRKGKSNRTVVLSAHYDTSFLRLYVVWS